jgi:glycerol-3-phosphate cytidylyltransferase
VSVVGYAPGAYDMFHVGHLRILRRARLACDYLIAGVVTDEVLEQAKGKRPVVPLEERLEIVRAVSFVDAAVVDTSNDKLVMWRELHFDVLFKGDDWKGTPKGERLETALAGVGARVVYFPYTAHTSSTLLRQQLISGLP